MLTSVSDIKTDDLVLDICTFKNHATFTINNGALAVHNIVILQNIFTHFKVLRFNLRLSRTNCIETILDSIGASSGNPAADKKRSTIPELNRRIKSSCSERRKRRFTRIALTS